MKKGQFNRTKWAYIQNIAYALKHTMALYGYEVFDTSIIEPAELFLTKAGDQLVTKLFTFQRQGQQLALRPEFTASAAHHYITHHNHETVRWQFGGSIFEDDPSDFNHHYQHYSIGAELIGMAGSVAEAEIIALAAHGIMALEIKDWHIVIGHFGLMRQLLEYYQLDNRIERFLLNGRTELKDPTRGRNYVLQQLEKLLQGENKTQSSIEQPESSDVTTHLLGLLLDKDRRGETMGGRTQEDIAHRLLQKRKRASKREQIIRALDFLQEWGSIADRPDKAFSDIQHFIKEDDLRTKQTLSEWQKVVNLLQAYDIPSDKVKIQPELSRHWDYYTGLVFELYIGDTLVGGGGRYDELTRLIGGKNDAPAVGFAYYVNNLVNALPKQPDSDQPSVMILVTSDTQYTASSWASRLRSHGIKTILLTQQDESPENTLTLSIQADGSVSFNRAKYMPSQLDTLISDILQRQES